MLIFNYLLLNQFYFYLNPSILRGFFIFNSNIYIIKSIYLMIYLTKSNTNLCIVTQSNTENILLLQFTHLQTNVQTDVNVTDITGNTRYICFNLNVTGVTELYNQINLVNYGEYSVNICKQDGTIMKQVLFVLNENTNYNIYSNKKSNVVYERQ